MRSSKWLRGLGLALTLSMAMPGIQLVSGQAGSTADEAFRSDLTGFEIASSGPDWTMEEPDVDRASEFIAFSNGDNYAAVAFANDDTSSDDIAKVFTDSLEDSFSDSGLDFTVYNADSTTNTTTLVYTVGDDTVPVAIGVLRASEDVADDIDMIELVQGDGEDFADIYDSAQEEITVDGNALINGFDSAMVETTIGSGQETNSSATPEPADDDATPVTDTGNTSETRGATGVSTPESDDADAPGADATEDTDGPSADATEESTTDVRDLADVGIVDDGVYQSPTFGTDVTWDTSAWALPEDEDSLPSVNTAEAYDRLILFNLDANDSWVVLNTYEGANTPDEQDEAWTGSDWLAGEYGDDAEVLDSRVERDSTASIIRYALDGESYIVIQEYVVLGDGTVQNNYFYAPESEFVDAYVSAQDIQTEGSDAFPTYSINQVERVVGQ